MSWGSLALCPIPPQCTYTLIHAGARTHARTYTQNKTRGNHIASYFIGVIRQFLLFWGDIRREMLCVGSSRSSARSLRPVLLPLSGCSPLFVPAVRSLYSSSSSSPCSYIDSAGFSQSPEFAVRSWRKKSLQLNPTTARHHRNSDLLTLLSPGPDR